MKIFWKILVVPLLPIYYICLGAYLIIKSIGRVFKGEK